MDALSKRLLSLGQLGCILYGQDGHIWIHSIDNEDNGRPYSIDSILKNAGVVLNNKIYGGILEALDTIDEAFKRANAPTLEESFCEEILFMGNPKVDESRLSKTESDKGGIC
jgi:hypothetical protein